MRSAAATALLAAPLAALLLAACSGPAEEPDRTLGVPVTGMVTRLMTPPPAAGAFASEAPSPTVTTSAPPVTSFALPWCRSSGLAVTYLGGDTTTVDPATDTIERYRVTNTSTSPCRVGAWIGVTMIGVAGCPMPPVTVTTTTTTTATTTGSTPPTPATAGATATPACPAGPPVARGRTVRSTAWPAHDQQLRPGGSTTLSLLFADTFAPQSCADVWAPPDRLELRPAGDPQALVVPSKVYPCKGELVVAPLGFGL